MGYTTATPPTTYVPPEIKREFRNLLDLIATSDRMHGTNTPSATILLIIATARHLGVPPAELVNNRGD